MCLAVGAGRGNKGGKGQQCVCEVVIWLMMKETDEACVYVLSQGGGEDAGRD